MGKNIICKDCKKRKAVVKYSDEPVFAMTHGWGVTNICRQCYIKRIEDGIKQSKENLNKQKRLLNNNR